MSGARGMVCCQGNMCEKNPYHHQCILRSYFKVGVRDVVNVFLDGESKTAQRVTSCWVLWKALKKAGAEVLGGGVNEKPKINSVGWQHIRVDNNKTKPVFCSTASHHFSREKVCADYDPTSVMATSWPDSRRRAVQRWRRSSGAPLTRSWEGEYTTPINSAVIAWWSVLHSNRRLTWRGVCWERVEERVVRVLATALMVKSGHSSVRLKTCKRTKPQHHSFTTHHGRSWGARVQTWTYGRG